MKNIIKKNVILLAISMILLAPTVIVAQENQPQALLVYFDNETDIQVFDPDGFEYEFLTFGMELRQGDRISTTDSTAEIQLTRDGSIIKLSENSQFQVDELYNGTEASASRFTLQNGRMRAVVSRISRSETSRFSVRTRTAVGGVRGTDFIMEVIPDQTDALYVLDGAVEFANQMTGQNIMVGAGQQANTFATSFSAIPLRDSDVGRILGSMQFTDLDPEKVNASTAGDPEPEEPANNEDEDTGENEGTAGDIPGQGEPTPEQEQAARDGALDGLIGFLGGYLGMEIGSVTIDNETYGKVVLQPEFEFGNLGLGLYLPVIYTNDMFDPNSWYQPAGNNEWSFGTDAQYAGEADEAWLRIQDFYQDLWLKIRYVRWGEQRDPFFLQVGNISSMTLGHGILMQGYANDKDFPQVRKIGLNLGVDPGKIGMELIVNDLGSPQIIGTRLFLRPAHPVSRFAIGLSAATDLHPANDIAATEVDFADVINSDPAIIHFAADVDIPIVENDIFSVILFGDAGAFLPYLRQGVGTLNAGLQPQVLFSDSQISLSSLRNYGIMSGVFGEIIGIDYRLEYRNFHGIFSPYYTETYERFRGQRALEILDFLQDSNNVAYDNRIQGIYGEAGFDLFNEAIVFDLGYLWPWGEVADLSTNDYLQASIVLAPDLLPLGIYGSAYYTRTGFAQTIMNGGDINLFDANTVLEGEIIYPLTSTMHIAITLGTSASRDANGDQVYDSNGMPVSVFSMGFETRIGY